MQKGFLTLIGLLISLIIISLILIFQLDFLKPKSGSYPNPSAILKDVHDKLCIQVITPAINESTGQCQEFPTPCDLPSGWVKVAFCEEQLSK